MKFKQKLRASVLALVLVTSNVFIANANTEEEQLEMGLKNVEQENETYVEQEVEQEQEDEAYIEVSDNVVNTRNANLSQGKWSNEKGNWYYIKNGVKQKGWIKNYGKWYYLNDNGVMVSGWQQVSGKWYYLEANGEMATAWNKVGEKWYYLNSNGEMQIGWRQVSGKWYYLNCSGEMQIGWKHLNGKWYYFNSDGNMQTDWQQISDKWYYMYESGVMATNTTIGGSEINGSGVAEGIIQSSEITVTDLNTNLSEVAGKYLADKIKISPALGRKLHLQMLNPITNHWETKRIYTTPNEIEAVINLEYPSVWYSQASSSWRVYIPQVSGTDSYISSTVNVTAKRLYNNANGYIKIKDKIEVEAGGANLVKGTMGLRVAKVQRKLGMGYRWEIVDNQTINKVREFQRRNGLAATGVVDLKTWKKLGFSESSWYSLDTYVTPIKTKVTSTKEDHIETMINTAKSYLGTEYVVGAAGEPGTGIDCSGLVMQSMYSAGIDPYPISVVRHSKPGYEYESRNLFKLQTLKHVKYSERKRGDLIFYSNAKGVIIHVAIYLGNDKVIESWPEKVVIWPIQNKSRSRIAGVARVFE